MLVFRSLQGTNKEKPSTDYPQTYADAMGHVKAALPTRKPA
jgi:hypothetical protein